MAFESIGPLAGLTILRFAHAFASGGGVEQYLHDLDSVLLNRNSLTIVRMFIASEPTDFGEKVEDHGHGRLVLAPLRLPCGEDRQFSSDLEKHHSEARQFLRDHIFCNPLLWVLGTRSYVLNRNLTRRKGEVIEAGRRFHELIERYPVDLCMMHFFGGADADEVIQAARLRGIPFAVQNHYANDRFRHLAIRKHALLADGVAGVNALQVPNYLKKRFVNLTDGIDITLFDRRSASPTENTPQCPLIFMPARIIRPKGQLDLVRAAAHLCDRGLDFQVAFAGRVDSTRFFEELNAAIITYRLADRCRFLGVLNPESLRNWYAASTVVAFPTYHHEGLGRIIVEAQAMQVPVVAYATGGVPEGLRNGISGFLVPTGDIKALTDSLELLLRDPGRCQRMGVAGRQFVIDRYSLDAVASRHEAFYLETIRRRKKPPM